MFSLFHPGLEASTTLEMCRVCYTNDVDVRFKEFGVLACSACLMGTPRASSGTELDLISWRVATCPQSGGLSEPTQRCLQPAIGLWWRPQHEKHAPHHQAEVAPNAPVVDVLHFFLGTAAELTIWIDLTEADHTRRQELATSAPQSELRVFFSAQWLRTDDGHLALGDVDKLRKRVES